jgi:cytochrome c oxidase assembly protein subunit 15
MGIVPHAVELSRRLRLPAPSLGAQRVIAVLTVIAQCAIAVTGSVVRVTASGLGCPTWPDCSAGHVVPVAGPAVGELHQWIEFGNRLLTVAVVAVSILMLLTALAHRPYRRRYVLLAAAMPAGVLVEAVVGGITVLTDLSWWTVSIHFLLSAVLIWLSVLVLRAVGETDEPARPVVPSALRGLLVAQAGLLIAILVAGTLVTAAGPHAGSPGTPRLRTLPVAQLAQVHADLVLLFLGSIAALGFALRVTGTARRVWRRYWALVVLVIAQGALGITQYALGVPDVLVSFHVLGAVLVTVALARVWCVTRERAGAGARGAEPAEPARRTVRSEA